MQQMLIMRKHMKNMGMFRYQQSLFIGRQPVRQKTDKNGNYVNYYILHITWDETVQNNKETDMIYIMAG